MTMQGYVRWARVFGIFLAVKATAHVVTAALGWTALPPLLLGGLGLIWLVGAVFLLWTAQRAQVYLDGAQQADAPTAVRESEQGKPMTRTPMIS